MRRIVPLICLAATLLLVSASTAQAFDGYRRGFVLGGGLGPGLLLAKQKVEGLGFSAESEWDNEFALVTDFHIGAGLNDKLVLYYSSRVNWFWPLDGGTTLSNGIGTVAINIYTQSTAPSAYFTVGLGLSTLDAPFEEGAEASYGPGMRLGVGMELNPHWSMEFALTYGRADEDIGGLEFQSHLLSVQIVAIGMAY